jgi:hypothetical protein
MLAFAPRLCPRARPHPTRPRPHTRARARTPTPAHPRPHTHARTPTPAHPPARPHPRTHAHTGTSTLALHPHPHSHARTQTSTPSPSSPCPHEWSSCGVGGWRCKTHVAEPLHRCTQFVDGEENNISVLKLSCHQLKSNTIIGQRKDRWATTSYHSASGMVGHSLVHQTPCDGREGERVVRARNRIVLWRREHGSMPVWQSVCLCLKTRQGKEGGKRPELLPVPGTSASPLMQNRVGKA